MYLRIVVHICLLMTLAMAATVPVAVVEVEAETPAQDRSIVRPYDVNPYFGFRKYGELRYEPYTFLPSASARGQTGNAGYASYRSDQDNGADARSSKGLDLRNLFAYFA